MKVRYAVRCEKCKVLMHGGERGIRVHGRIWHRYCYIAWRTDREQRKTPHTGA